MTARNFHNLWKSQALTIPQTVPSRTIPRDNNAVGAVEAQRFTISPEQDEEYKAVLARHKALAQTHRELFRPKQKYEKLEFGHYASTSGLGLGDTQCGIGLHIRVPFRTAYDRL